MSKLTFYIAIQLMNNMQGLSQNDKIKSEKEIKILTQLGLSRDEAQVYHVLLVSKESTVGKISRSINFSRAKIYGIIDNLLADGIVVEGNKHPKTYFPVDPKEISNRKLKNMQKASELVDEELAPLFKSKPVDYLETLTVKDMEIFSQVVDMCERANETIDVIAAILPSEMPRNVCKAFSDASGRGIKVRMLFPDKKTNLDLSRLEGYFEVKLAKSIPAAGIILIDDNEFCVGGLDVPESENTLIGMWMNQPELARLAKLIFNNLYDSSELYES